jgi:hypothetical protein
MASWSLDTKGKSNCRAVRLGDPGEGVRDSCGMGTKDVPFRVLTLEDGGGSGPGSAGVLWSVRAGTTGFHVLLGRESQSWRAGRWAAQLAGGCVTAKERKGEEREAWKLIHVWALKFMFSFRPVKRFAFRGQLQVK